MASVPCNAEVALETEPRLIMEQHFYRFRSIDALLGRHAELEAQEIYFASPAQLNDPMEGFKNLYWQGDEIVWRALFKNYLFCMMKSLTMVMLQGEGFDKSSCEGFVHQTDADLPDAPIRQIYAGICEAFFAQSVVGDLIRMLATSSAKVRHDELGCYLRALNPFAFTLSKDALMPRLGEENSGLALDAQGDAVERQNLRALAKIIKQRAETADDEVDLTFEVNARAAMQVKLINHINNTRTPLQRAWMFFAADFVDFYIRSLENLVHPAWYAACFVAAPNNASMWGSYADGHKGMCLKFASKLNTEGQPTLSLYRAVAVGGGRENIKTHFAYSPLTFEAVRYGDPHPEINFFSTLGTVPMGKLSFWYAGPDGRQSGNASGPLSEKDDWRQSYWENYHAGRVTKTGDWEHEAEHRLILDASFDQPRLLKYQFKDLTGICFGIKTSDEDKIRVIRIIEEKCRKERRPDFEFYQARYSNYTKTIEIVLLRLLKVDLNAPSLAASQG